MIAYQGSDVLYHLGQAIVHITFISNYIQCMSWLAILCFEGEKKKKAKLTTRSVRQVASNWSYNV